MTKKIYIIGTYHGDPDGQRRLEGLLNMISPELIALEFHKDRDEEYFMRSKIYHKHEGEEELNRRLEQAGLKLTPKQKASIIEKERVIRSIVGYEVRVCRNHTQRNPNTRLEYIDIPLLDANNRNLDLGESNDEIREGYLALLNMKDYEFLRAQKDNALEAYSVCEDLSHRFENDPNILDNLKELFPESTARVFKQIFDPTRDDFLADNIKRLYNNTFNRLVVIVGLLHLPRLKSRILELNPITISLSDYDYL